MPLTASTVSHNYNFAYDHIVVVESLPSEDKPTGRELYSKVIAPLARRSGLGAKFISAATHHELLDVLHGVASTCESERHSPIVHLEMHGTRDGLRTADGGLVTWSDLKVPLTRINVASKLNLGVSVAACSGEYLLKCVVPTDRAPVCWLLGCGVPVWDSVLERGFQHFYEVFLTDGDLIAAWRGLNEIGKPEQQVFGLWPAKYFFRRTFAAYCEQMLSPPVLTLRVNELHAALVARGAVLLRDGPAVRERLRSALLNRGYWLEKYKSLFFMLDLYPANAERFDMTLEDVLATDL